MFFEEVFVECHLAGDKASLSDYALQKVTRSRVQIQQTLFSNVFSHSVVNPGMDYVVSPSPIDLFLRAERIYVNPLNQISHLLSC